MNWYLVLLVCSVMISSFSQILLKKSSQKTYPNWIREYLNVYVICGYGLLFLSLFMTMLSYKGFTNFATVPLFESLGYVFVLVLSYLFFKEKITLRKAVGIALILAGIIVYNVL